MGIPQRIFFPGAIYHVTLRGNNKRNIFLADSDRYKYLKSLEKIKKKYNFKLYCYVLMDNHIHLLLETTHSANLAKIMQSINTGYTMYFNKKYNHIGHLFQGRYHCILVDKDNYLLELSRYIHLNPVRAKFTEDPLKYKWSSYAEYIKEMEGLIEKDLILNMISLNKNNQVELYKKFVKSRSEAEIQLQGLIPRFDTEV